MLRNLTQNRIISKEYRICRSYFSKLKGLMFSKQKNLVFVFEKEILMPLHMLFVFYPIDLVFLDKSKRVVEIKEDFKPFTFYTPLHKAKYILELKKGSAEGIKERDKIEFNA